VSIRAATVADHQRVLAVADEWWGGRAIAGLAQRLFFDHFADTSLIAEDEHQLIGFLIGFLSQTHSDEAYIHMVAVHPDRRDSGLARDLYAHFFDLARRNQRATVTCITSPVNQGSIAFHVAMGFTSELHPDHDGPGNDRIVFSRDLDPIDAMTTSPVDG
jgi:ribosomal protein S18 acetylase RimI-like enzyme